MQSNAYRIIESPTTSHRQLPRNGTSKICLAIFVMGTCCSSGALAQDGPPLILHSAVGAGVAEIDESTNSTNGNGKFFVGRLERVQKNDSKTSERGKRWALMDADNQVAAFVAPTTKYDLRRYLGKEIGITARTFSSPTGEPPYVLIDSVTPMFASEWKETAVDEDAERQPISRTVLASHETTVKAGQPRRRREGRRVGHERVVAAQDWQNISDSDVVVMDGSYVDDGYVDDGYIEDGHIGDGVYIDDGYVTESGGGVGGCGNPSCTSCSTACLPIVPNTPATCGPPGWMWIRGENIQWWGKGMSTPPLLTTSTGTAAGQAGVLGLASTSTLYGGDDNILTDSSSGFRIRFGGYFGPQRRLGYEGEYFSMSSNELFSTSSDANGSPNISRPFFNMNPRVNGNGALNPPPVEDAELVSFPGLLRGTATVESDTEFRGASGFLRWNRCCKQGCRKQSGCPPYYGYGILGPVGRCGYPPFNRSDFLLGYQYYELTESLRITEDLTSLDANNLGTFDIFDSFETRNTFNGAMVGSSWEGGVNRWTLELMMRVAIGAMKQSVTVNGQTTISPLVTPAETLPGGLLAQRTNIGTYERTEFTMIPQINANLGFYLTPRLRAILGYSLIYVGNVARPGDQIDLDVNPDLLPPEVVPFVGPLRPGFDFRQSDYWAQGLNIGLDLRW